MPSLARDGVLGNKASSKYLSELITRMGKNMKLFKQLLISRKGGKISTYLNIKRFAIALLTILLWSFTSVSSFADTNILTSGEFKSATVQFIAENITFRELDLTESTHLIADASDEYLKNEFFKRFETAWEQPNKKASLFNVCQSESSQTAKICSDSLKDYSQQKKVQLDKKKSELQEASGKQIKDCYKPGVNGKLCADLVSKTREDKISQIDRETIILGEVLKGISLSPIVMPPIVMLEIKPEVKPIQGGNDVIERANVDTTRRNFYLVDTNAPINEDGELKNWEIWAKNSSNVQLIIFRKGATSSSGVTSWSIVGKSDEKTPNVGKNSFSLSSPIKVKKGDFVGLYYPDRGSVSFSGDDSALNTGDLSRKVLLTTYSVDPTVSSFAQSSNRTYSVSVK
ncbi:MAG: hypothetical protein HEQ19_25390 [Gloeotrichia echinulata CP02]|jgi:hypothetical protein|nr:hypothetical protein [Gloeotrichia echinulata DEX184]